MTAKFFLCSWSIAVLTFVASACAPLYRIVQDDIARAVVGRISWREWQREAEWTSYTDTTYKPDAASLKSLTSLITPEISFRLIAGTWCDDSREEMPRLFPLLTVIGVNTDAVELWGVSRSKREPTAIVQTNTIEYVPTLVVIRSGKEIGRIVEHPKTSWEADLKAILQQQ